MSTSLLDTRQNLRVDQNFIYQITNFKKYGKEDEKLVKELIIYMTLHSQKNLFGEIELDPIDFCKEMGVDRANISRKHKNPIYYKIYDQLSIEEHNALEKKHGAMSKYRIWKTKFENALLILQHEKFYFSSEHNKKNTDVLVVLDNFTYIKSLKILFKKRKITYNYRPTQEFEEAVTKKFLTINLKTYIKLRKPSLEDFYLKLLYRTRSESSKGNNEIYYGIRELAELMNISTNKLDDKNGFSKLKDAINRKLNKHFFIKSTIDNKVFFQKSKFEEDFPSLKFTWKKGNTSKYKNIATFSWLKVSDEVIRERTKNIYNDLFYTKFFQSLTKNYRENYRLHETDKSILINDFIVWLFSNQDYKIKHAIYVAEFSKIRGNTIDSASLATTFFFNIIEIGKYLKNHQFIEYKENEFLFISKKDNKTYKYKELKNLIFEVSKNKKYFDEYYG